MENFFCLEFIPKECVCVCVCVCREVSMLLFIGLQRVGHNLVTEQQQHIYTPGSPDVEFYQK